MKIEEYIRIKIADKVRPLLIKNECEICQVSENLELHHVKPFAILLKECHKSLNIEYKKDKSDYTDMEIKNITNWMLGMHLNIRCLTLCEKCHENIHMKNGGYYNTTDNFKEYYRIQNIKREYEREEYIKQEVIPYLENNIDKVMLQVKDREELIEKLGVKSNGKLLKNINTLNMALEEKHVNYRIIEFSTSRIINNKKKNYKNAWRIEKMSY